MNIVINGTQSINQSSKAPTKTKDANPAEPAPVERLNWLMFLVYVHGDINICKNLINEEINKSSGRNEFAHYQKAVILKDEGKIQEALESFQICHKLNSNSVENIKQVGNCLFLLQKYKLALEAFLEAEKLVTKPDWEVYQKLGECLFKLDELSNAKDYTRRAVQLAKQEISYALLIKILVMDNDLRSAIAVANAALECYPESTATLTDSGLLYLKMGQIDHAFERLNTILTIDPYNSKALLAAGCIIQSRNDYDTALSKYKMALNSNSESVPLWNNIGMCFYGKQKFVAAISCLKRALWHSPLNWRILYNLGLVHLTTKQAASAFNFFCAAVNLRPDNGLAFMLLGCTLMELGDMENAARALRQSIFLAPEDLIVLANTIICLHHLGDVSNAIETYRKYCELECNSPNVNSTLEELSGKFSELFSSTINTEESKMKMNEDNDNNGTQIIQAEMIVQKTQLDPDEV